MLWMYVPGKESKYICICYNLFDVSMPRKLNSGLFPFLMFMVWYSCSWCLMSVAWCVLGGRSAALPVYAGYVEAGWGQIPPTKQHIHCAGILIWEKGLSFPSLSNEIQIIQELIWILKKREKKTFFRKTIMTVSLKRKKSLCACECVCTFSLRALKAGYVHL